MDRSEWSMRLSSNRNRRRVQLPMCMSVSGLDRALPAGSALKIYSTLFLSLSYVLVPRAGSTVSTNSIAGVLPPCIRTIPYLLPNTAKIWNDPPRAGFPMSYVLKRVFKKKKEAYFFLKGRQRSSSASGVKISMDIGDHIIPGRRCTCLTLITKQPPAYQRISNLSDWPEPRKES
ncbi:hypothetical protein EVAR_22306_1 [Eumeta japonica]|uniref:Uncharacterized protein n=1 Tax=Eumeta variegata TaxID=151549 RepID=A0A4C1UBW8_EUMVA|nr:hypothetical protein EVAR_22306_1 [Eumeta japonica]